MAITQPGSNTGGLTTTPTYAAEFIKPLGSMLADYTAGLFNQPINLEGMMPKVAGQNVLQQAAQQQAATQGGLGTLQFDPTTGQLTGAGQGTGVAGYQPYLNQATALASPTGYQQYMSPYQQQVIEPTLQQFDFQSQINKQAIPASAISQGAFGGAREGIAGAQYQASSDLNRAQLLGNLLNQGYGQALGQANIGVTQQQQLANLQPSLTAQNINLLGTAGAGQQTYSQNILNAAQQGNQIAAQYPTQYLSGIAGLYNTIAGSTPMEPGTPLLTNPSLVAAQSAAGLYGALYPPKTNININQNQSNPQTTSSGGGGGGSDYNPLTDPMTYLPFFF
jgi:hypothetical protein